uniref:Nuclease HARBI1 n=1 Tax=Nicotiana tabacum TaxID=4097 RepID=A0A1S4DC76_TOBAC
LRKSVFLDLSKDLTDKYGLKPTREMSVYEELGMFLMICAHGAGNRLVQEIFQHSGETTYRHFHSVLNAIGKLARDIIQPHPSYNDGVGDHKPCNQRYLPFFKDCIGALDGTHVKARLPQGQEIPYIGRKCYPNQNILDVVDFNICFTFAWAEWEGAAHDNRIFGEALRRPELNFSHPSGDKYYLVDAGYSHIKGYMAPYKGDNVRYHLPEFRRGATRQLRAPNGHKEMFNYLHSSCRNIVERTFGVWKARWSILRDMPFYHIDTQRDIVLATMAIHNYIRKKCKMDNAFQEAENERYVPRVDPDIGRSTRVNVVDEENVENQGDNNIWMAIRDLIAQDIYDS